MESKRFTLNVAEAKSILRVMLWSFGSATAVALLGLLQSIDVPEAWVFLVPIANSLVYSFIEWIKGQQ